MIKKAQKGLGNPAALAVTSALAPSINKGVETAGEIAKENAASVIRTLFVLFGGGAAIYLGRKQYKKWRSEKYANDNIGNPNLVAATIIRSSIKEFKIPGFAGMFIPSFNIYTDEDALFKIASDPQVNIKSVAKSYKILFDSNLAIDVQEGLSTNELVTFYRLLQSGISNNTTTLFPIGSELFVAQKQGITINTAVQQGEQWSGTQNLLKKAAFNEKIGEIVANGVVPAGMQHEGENYYIIKDCNWFGFGCEHGVVVQEQVRDHKL